MIVRRKDNWDLLFEALESFVLLSLPFCRCFELAMPDKLVRRLQDEAVHLRGAAAE